MVNLQGDVIRLVSGTGATVAEYKYDPYGRVIFGTGTMAEVNPLRYRGYYYDAETKFYYLQSRYYDPVICRFVNADGYASTGHGFLGCNMFAYCNNSPFNYADYAGYSLTNLPGIAIEDGRCISNKPEEEDTENLEDTKTDSKTDTVSVVPIKIQRGRSPRLFGAVYPTMTPSDYIGMVGSYNYLKAIVTGTGLEVHHLIEKRFWVAGNELSRIYSSKGSMPSVVLTNEMHQAFTNDWRAAFPYGKTAYSTTTYSDLMSFCRAEYGGHADWLFALRDERCE